MISHKHKCIFIHIPKTGGTSVEIALQGEGSKLPIKHKTVLQYKKESSEIFNKYFKFTIVRNPWDLMVSWWKWRSKWRKNPIDFSKYLKHQEDVVPASRGICKFKGGMTCLDYISGASGVLVNKICRFENLQMDFNAVCDKMGIPQQKLPHKNKSKHKHYTEYYDDETREIVAEKYRKDIEYFGYEFGED